MQIKYRKGHNIHCFKKRRANIKTFLVPRLLKILFEQMGNTWKYLFIILFKGTAWNNTLILWVLKACFWLLQVYFSTYYFFFTKYLYDWATHYPCCCLRHGEEWKNEAKSEPWSQSNNNLQNGGLLHSSVTGSGKEVGGVSLSVLSSSYLRPVAI